MPPIFINGQEVVKRYVGIQEVVAAYVGAQQVFASGFDPVTTSPEAFYDVSDFSTLFQDAAGTVPVTAIGQSVARINDKSGHARHATATGGDQPLTLLQDASGGYYLGSDGASRALVADYSQSAYPLTLVCAADNDSASNYGVFGLWEDDNHYKHIYLYDGRFAYNDRYDGVQNAGTESIGANTTPHVIFTEFLTASTNMIVDGFDGSSASANSNGFGLAATTKIFIGKTFVAGNYATFKFYGGLVFARQLLLAERKNIEHWLITRSGAPYDVLDSWIAEGDSITQGYFATGMNGYVKQVVDSAPRFGINYNQAVSGNTMADVTARLSTVSSRCASMIANGLKPIVTLLIGQNDRPTTTGAADTLYASIASYVATVKGYGAKVVVCTNVACDPATYSAWMTVGRPYLTALIRANSAGADAICDFAADAGLNTWSGTNYYDDLHPNDAGHAIMKNIMMTTLSSIRASKY